MNTDVHKKTVFVGLSGGVDSSVAAKRLIEAGYSVVGVFIKTWQPDFITCTWEKERLDAMRVAAHLNIPFLTCDAEEAYKQNVAEYMIREYEAGRTPNPDVMCNKQVKFGVFLDFALAHGADMVATGHYARIEKQNDASYTLLRGIDAEKDQSYFLWTLTQAQLSRILFPIGDSRKDEVRREAEIAGLPTYAKADSQGVCFLGAIDMKDFLSHYIPRNPGPVVDATGTVIGSHDGALFYTLGQRHGFTIHTTQANHAPLYVVSRDIAHNTLVVGEHAAFTTTHEHIILTEVHAMRGTIPRDVSAQFRYRQKPFTVTYTGTDNACGMLTVHHDAIEKPSSGQSCVFYQGEVCLGGAVIP